MIWHFIPEVQVREFRVVVLILSSSLLKLLKLSLEPPGQLLLRISRVNVEVSLFNVLLELAQLLIWVVSIFDLLGDVHLVSLGQAKIIHRLAHHHGVSRDAHSSLARGEDAVGVQELLFTVFVEVLRARGHRL